MKFLHLLFSLLILVCSCTSPTEIDTPERLADAIIKAMETKNSKSLENLIHPSSKSISVVSGIQRLLKNPTPSSYEVEHTDIENNPNYDNDIPGFRVGKELKVFPVAPSKMLLIYYKENGARKLLMAQTIVKHNGQWFIVWPTEERKINQEH